MQSIIDAPNYGEENSDDTIERLYWKYLHFFQLTLQEFYANLPIASYILFLYEGNSSIWWSTHAEAQSVSSA